MVSLSAQSMKVLRERVPLFAQFEDAELATIMHRSRRRVLKDGDVLIAEGTLATKLFVLVSGQAAVYRSVVNLFQAHSFEDRVLKKAPVYIRRAATVRSGVVMLYGADVGENAIVEPQSVIMKNETLNGERRYIGAPTQSR